MEIKLELERIWLDKKCRCPLNIVWWRISKYSAIDAGGRKLGSWGYREADNIWYSKGKRNKINASCSKAFKRIKRVIV